MLSLTLQWINSRMHAALEQTESILVDTKARQRMTETVPSLESYVFIGYNERLSRF